MDKKHFALKLIPCRPTFAQDMTDEERAIMQQHVVYWREVLSLKPNKIKKIFSLSLC